MQRRQTLLQALAASLLLVVGPLGADAPLRDGDIVLFRHAPAPGVGDPPQFRLGDCSTQRNLDDAGRRQAQRLGPALRQRAGPALPVTAVWHSQWCRTRDTALLAFPDLPAREAPAFNSFFGDRSNEPRQTAAARAQLQAWRGPGLLVVVTHQVNIQALVGETTASGDGIVLRWQGDRPVVVARLPPPD
jgi:phosphohistidine phosphatase SixA